MKKKIISTLFFIVLLCLLFSCRDNINEPTAEVIEDETPFIVSLEKIQYPNERVNWTPGNSYKIKWEITRNLDKVKIVLLKKYTQVHVISDGTLNNGEYNWSVPADLPGSHHYRIKLVSPYNLGASATSVEFEIQNPENGPPELE